MATTPRVLISVVETSFYLARSKSCMTEDERTALVNLVAADPECGVLLDGGIRKLRFPVAGRGKSGGVRVVYLFAREAMPIFLLTVFAKNEKDSLTKGELTKLVGIAKQIVRHYSL
jgi:hypothetical protein